MSVGTTGGGMQGPSPTIRVLHCCHDLAGGGAEKQLRILARHSRQHHMEAAIFCVNDFGVTEADTQCPIYRFDRRRKLDLRIFSAVNDAIRNFAPDVVHAWLPPVVSVPAIVGARLADLPCVFSYRNAMFVESIFHPVEFVLMAAFVNKIVANNPIEQSTWIYRWAYRRKHGEQIGNAIEAPVLPEKSPARQDRRPVILFAGRICPQKNWRILIQALQALIREVDCELLICGVGEDQAALEQEVRSRGLAGNVRLLGYRTDLPALMNESDVLVMPSLYEGSPNVVLEACAHGLPQVLSAIVPHQSFMEAGTAVKFEATSAEQLAEAMRRVLHDAALLRRMSENGRLFAARHGPDAFTSRYYEAYRDSIARHRRGLSCWPADR